MEKRIYKDTPGALLLLAIYTRDGWRVKYDGPILAVLEREV